MSNQKPTAVAGAAVTTFLLVGVATIEAVTAATGAEIGPGIVGVFAGVVAGLIAAWVVSWRWPAVAEWGRSVLLGYAVFGLTIVSRHRRGRRPPGRRGQPAAAGVHRHGLNRVRPSNPGPEDL